MEIKFDVDLLVFTFVILCKITSILSSYMLLFSLIKNGSIIFISLLLLILVIFFLSILL